MKVIEDKNLYPDEKTPLLNHYSDFDSVYIALLPFFKLYRENYSSFSSKKIATIDDINDIEDEEIINILKTSNTVIYASNDDYPNNEEILEKGIIVTWSEIISNTKIQNNRDLNKALMTSIGGYKKKLQREDLLEILNNHTINNEIWHPTEGLFDTFSISLIYKLLIHINIKSVIIEDETYENSRTIDIQTLTEKEFQEMINSDDYYIYTDDKSLLFSISWDFFFFFIAINENVISKELVENIFEGFWANEKTNHLWTWKEGEMEKILNT
ncbi:DUF2711 family protein [Flammeovirga pectinis]|uniref:DUF2711 family protein n=1 Tax=Flammeovirga pectinis TaxID=2494373 RepID=A0A3S9P4I0_9BACT|nr:DUF2711 family protein [Flammeovirga pectinis]AZQ63120.1 DUF2711 family protein [Flammeovirga pectinis]